MPSVDYRPPLPPGLGEMWRELTSPQPTPRIIDPELRDMTPAQIYAKHGEDVARYIIDLRQTVEIWKRIAYDRTRVTPPQSAEER